MSFVLIPLDPPPDPPFAPLFTAPLNLLNTAAPPNNPAAAPNPPVVSPPIPKNLRSNFSAGIKNAKNIIANIGFTVAISNDDPKNAEYINRWNGCINKLNKYSLNHELKACAFPSLILSNGYVNATIGAINVKNAIVTTLFT